MNAPNVRNMRPIQIDQTDDLAEALEQAIDLLVEFMGESHPAIVRLSAPLCRYNVGQAQAHVQSNAVRQWLAGAR